MGSPGDRVPTTRRGTLPLLLFQPLVADLERRDCRQREANKRLRRLLEEERKALKQVRQNYANELRHRTEMEMLLRSCVEDVRNEISRRYDSPVPTYYDRS